LNRVDGDEELSFEESGNVQGLKPLPPDLRPETREFVDAMRRLLAGTGKSLRQFAAYHHFSPASVSRYLNGKRLPDKVFVDALLKSACLAHQVELAPGMQEHAYRLHREALLTDQPGRYKLQMASDQLEEAILAREQAELTIRELKSSVSDQKHQLTLLERQKYQITHTAAEERRHTAVEIERYRGREGHLKAQCAELRDEIARLEAELEKAELEREEARARCRDLEESLALVEKEAEWDELHARVDVMRQEMVAADVQATQRLADLERANAEAEAEAEHLRRQAAQDAEAKTAEAEKLLTAARQEAERIGEEVRAAKREREDINAEINRVQDVLEALESFEAPGSGTAHGVRAGGATQQKMYPPRPHLSDQIEPPNDDTRSSGRGRHRRPGPWK